MFKVVRFTKKMSQIGCEPIHHDFTFFGTGLIFHISAIVFKGFQLQRTESFLQARMNEIYFFICELNARVLFHDPGNAFELI